MIIALQMRRFGVRGVQGVLSGCFGVFWAWENLRRQEDAAKTTFQENKICENWKKIENWPKMSKSRKIWRPDTHRRYHIRVLWARCDCFFDTGIH